MGQATDVGRQDLVGRTGLQVRQLAIAKLGGKRRLQDRIGAGRPAAQVRLGKRHDLGATGHQQRLDLTPDLLTMLQGAGRMKGQPRRRGSLKAIMSAPAALSAASRPAQRLQPLALGGQELGEVAGHGAHLHCLLGIKRVVAQQMRIVLDHCAAARGIDNDGLGTACLVRTRPSLGVRRQQRPPGVDVSTGIVERTRLIIEMMTDRAAAARARRHNRLDAERIQDPGGRRVDRRNHCRLHATVEQDHLASMRTCRPGSGIATLGHLRTERFGQQRAHGLTEAHRGIEEAAPGHAFAQGATQQSVACRPLHLPIDQLAADIDQMPVLHTRRTGALAVTASQAAVEMLLGLAGRRDTFDHLLDQIDPPARTVELVAQQLVSRAGGGAKAAMHARSQDRVGFDAVGRIAQPVGKIGLHGSRP